MKRIHEILAPLVPFLADESVTTVCLTPTDKPGGNDDDGRRRRSTQPKPPRPVPSPAMA